MLILLLNPWASWLIAAMQPCLRDRNKAMVSGKQPNGGSGTTPIFLAPKPYKSCYQTYEHGNHGGGWGIEKGFTAESDEKP